jgi:hemerythrin
MEHFSWEPDYASGYTSMDDTHREFVADVDRLLTCPDAELSLAFGRFAAHARAHFDEENRWMTTTGYTSAGCHIDEHNAVLKSVDEVARLLDEGHTRPVRAIADALADWFPEHAQVMDFGLARWLQQRALGGAPVKMHRQADSVRQPDAALSSRTSA